MIDLIERLATEALGRPIESAFILLFFIIALDRPVGLLAKAVRKRKSVNKDWQSNFSNQIGASRDIVQLSERLAFTAQVFVISKPVFLIADLVLGTIYIDKIGVAILGLATIYFYQKAVRIFRLREGKGFALRTPIEIKKAWLELSLYRVGYSMNYILFSLVTIIGHSIITLVFRMGLQTTLSNSFVGFLKLGIS